MGRAYSGCIAQTALFESVIFRQRTELSHRICRRKSRVEDGQVQHEPLLPFNRKFMNPLYHLRFRCIGIALGFDRYLGK